MYTVRSIFAASSDAHPHRPFLCIPPREERDYLNEGAEYSFADVARTVERLEQAYAKAGFGHGHRACLLLENRPDFLVHWLALNGLGVSIVPINPAYRAEEIAYVLDHAEPDLVVTLKDRAELEAALRSRDLPTLRIGGAQGLDETESPPSANTPAPRRDAPGAASEAALLYTSGTTARPKGCVLTNEYIISTGRWYASNGGQATYLMGTDRLYSPLPLFHMAGLSLTTIAMMITGGCLILPERFNAKYAWRDVVNSRATVMHYLGVIVAALLAQPPTLDEARHKLRFSMGVGANPEQRAAAMERFGIAFVEGWGMTETGRSCFAVSESAGLEFNKIGRSEPGFEMVVLDEGEQPVEDRVIGELCVRHSAETPRKGFFSGYLKDAEATESAWRGGWFHTGDSAWRHEDGAFVFVDRIKHLIRRAGENISAAEVEAVLSRAPGVRQLAVVAGADDLRQEEVVAIVVTDAAATEQTAIELFDFCAGRLAYFKLPAWIAFAKAIPLTSTNKIQKHSLLGADRDPARLPGAIDLRARKTAAAKESSRTSRGETNNA